MGKGEKWPQVLTGLKQIAAYTGLPIETISGWSGRGGFPIRREGPELTALRLDVDNWFRSKQPFVGRLMFRAGGPDLKTTDGKVVWGAASLKRHGVSRLEVVAYLKQTGGGCDICGRRFSVNGEASRPNLDHDHDEERMGTWKVRGILCTTCNAAIGLLSDDASLLRCAADYIENPPWGKKRAKP